jgi:hypothetical protein
MPDEVANPTRNLRTNSSLATSLSDRLLNLFALCPDGKMLRARARERIVECWREGGTCELTFKMMLVSDVTGYPILDAVARLDGTGQSERLTLHRRQGDLIIERFTKKEERYLAALLSWAETALRAAKPTAKTRRALPWQRDLIKLLTCLTGQSQPAAAMRLEHLFASHSASHPQQRSEALLDMLCAEGWMIQLDWKEKEPDQLRDLLGHRLGGTPILRAGPPGNMIEQAATWLADRNHHLLEVESGMDAHLLAIVPHDRADEALQLLASAGRNARLHFDC